MPKDEFGKKEAEGLVKGMMGEGVFEREEKNPLNPELKKRVDELFAQAVESERCLYDKAEIALKNKLISPQQGEEVFEVINIGRELHDRYVGGERTETLLRELEDYSQQLQEKKNEIWGSMEIAERKSGNKERNKSTGKKAKQPKSRKPVNNSLLKKPTELAADIADSQPATFRRGKQEFYTGASQPDDAREEAARQKNLVFLSKNNNLKDKKELSEEKRKETETKELLEPKKLAILEKFGKEFYNTLKGSAAWEGYNQKREQETLRIQTEVFLAAALKETVKEEDKAEKIVGYLIAKIESR